MRLKTPTFAQAIAQRYSVGCTGEIAFMKHILVIGASGQIGTDLVVALRKKYGTTAVVAADIRPPAVGVEAPFVQLDILDKKALKRVVDTHRIDEVYLLAALLSVTAEKQVEQAWRLNMEGLFNVLNLAKEQLIEKVFWPSSIAVFGATTPKQSTPQHTVTAPSTVYGISKLAGEGWCRYYAQNYGVDVRSIRYPGLVSYTSLPGGGTTDYAVDIFHAAKREEPFHCFLNADTQLPMMYMEDAVNATIQLMEAPSCQIGIRSSYNVAGVSFTPKQLVDAIREHYPLFEVHYRPDFRQQIADSWPDSIDDSVARRDWGWKAKCDLTSLTKIMLENVSLHGAPTGIQRMKDGK